MNAKNYPTGIEKIFGIATDRGGRVENPLLHPRPPSTFRPNQFHQY